MNDTAISVPEAARIAGVTDSAILQRIASGKLLARVFSGKAKIVSRNSLLGAKVDKKEFDRAVGKLMNVPEACEMLGVTECFVYRLIERGHLEGFRLNGKSWAVVRKSVEKNAREYVPGATRGWVRQPGLPARRKPKRKATS
jgi:excisionase family DNA binding protein